MNHSTTKEQIVGWACSSIFCVIGILNLLFVHPVPGIFYLLLACAYLPQTNTALKKRFDFAMPLFIKVIVALVVLWGTLAVTDLAEILGL